MEYARWTFWPIIYADVHVRASVSYIFQRALNSAAASRTRNGLFTEGDDLICKFWVWKLNTCICANVDFREFIVLQKQQASTLKTNFLIGNKNKTSSQYELKNNKIRQHLKLRMLFEKENKIIFSEAKMLFCNRRLSPERNFFLFRK